MNMLNDDWQKRILERVSFVKKEVEDEQDVEEEEVKKEPEVPPTTKVSIETQTGFPDEAPQAGSSHQREVPTSTASSHQREEAKEEKSINDDDTAPPVKESATLICYGQDISGNEEDSILRELSKCFSDGYHSIWAGFYSQGFPAFPNNRHMLWHKKYRQTNKPHDMTWFEIDQKHMMEAYIQRHKDEKVMDALGDIKKNAEYSCSDPRLHLRVRDEVNRFTRIATERHQGDFESLHGLVNDYIKDHHCVPYVIIFQLLAMRYLGAGLLETEHLDWDYPHRSSKSLSCMSWNLGSWNRKTHRKCPVPEHLEKFRPHIRFDLNTEHEPIGDKSLHNNYFVTAIKNFAAHIFFDCEANSLYESRERLEESGWETYFSDFTDLMCAARLGKDGYIIQTAGYSTEDDDIDPRLYHGQSLRSSGGEHSIVQPMRKKTSHVQECL